MEQSLEMRVKSILTEITKIGTPETIKNEASLINDFGMDSVQILSLISRLEEEFGITFKDRDLSIDVFGTVATLIEFVGKYVN